MQFYDHFCRNFFVICDCKVQNSRIASIIIGLSVICILICCNIKWISCSYCDILVNRSMIYRIFSYKFQWVISFISFKYTHCPFRKRYTKFVCFAVDKLESIACFEMTLSKSSCINRYHIVFAKLYTVDFRDKLYLLFRLVVYSHKLTQSVQVEIRERLFWERGSSFISNCSTNFGKGIKVQSWLLNSVDVTSDELKFGVFIFFTTMIFNRDPSSYISFIFLLIDSNSIVSFPTEPCGPICNLTISSDLSRTIDFPVESGKSKETWRQTFEGYSIDVIENLDPILSLQDVSTVIA